LKTKDTTLLPIKSTTMALNRSMKMKENVSNGESDEDENEMRREMDPAVGVCSICKTSKEKADYTTIQWKRFRSSVHPPKFRDCKRKRQEKNGWKSSQGGAGTESGIIKKARRKARGGDDPIPRACSICMIPKTWDHFSTRKIWKAAGKGLAEGKCKDCEQKERLDELNRTLGCNPTDTDTTRMCSSCDQPKEMSSSFTNKEWKKQSGKSKRNACHASGDGKESSEQVTEDTSKTSSDSDSDAPLFLIDRIGSTGNPHSDVNEAEKKRSHEAETSDLAERATKKPRLEETERALPIERACSMCKVRKTREYFSKTKWKAAGKGLEDGKCKVCVDADSI
jgi:hypothetical protein